VSFSGCSQADAAVNALDGCYELWAV